jgi:hypothetical protein
MINQQHFMNSCAQSLLLFPLVKQMATGIPAVNYLIFWLAPALKFFEQTAMGQSQLQQMVMR